MRIGQVTQDNYKEFLKILGIKNPKNLEKLNGEDGKGKSVKDNPNRLTIADLSCFDTIERKRVAMGLSEEGMMVRPGEAPRKFIIDVCDKYKQKVIDKVRQMVLSQSTGRHISAEQGDELCAIYKEYRSTIPPSDRMPATYTLSEIAFAEERRLVEFIRSQVPGWQSGMAFDPKILTGSNWGMGFDVKA